MRDINRIDLFCDKLKEYWKKVPDWRFGQLVENMKRYSGINDLFYIEEDEFLKILDSFFNKDN